MSGFSPAWLALREPADNAARSGVVLDACAQHFSGHDMLRICDLGAGTGSTLRACAEFFPDMQQWTLVDHDAANLAVAYDVLADWADAASRAGDALNLAWHGKAINVRARVHDFAQDPSCWPQGTHLVTASALFDLTSEKWIARFVSALGRIPLLAALSFDSVITSAPAHALDARIADAFNRHQHSDKGFGPAAGSDAARVLEEELTTAGYTLTAGESPWVLPPSKLQSATAQGIAGAAVETGAVTRAEADAWLAHARTRLSVGHRDVFAV